MVEAYKYRNIVHLVIMTWAFSYIALLEGIADHHEDNTQCWTWVLHDILCHSFRGSLVR